MEGQHSHSAFPWSQIAVFPSSHTEYEQEYSESLYGDDHVITLMPEVQESQLHGWNLFFSNVNVKMLRDVNRARASIWFTSAVSNDTEVSCPLHSWRPPLRSDVSHVPVSPRALYCSSVSADGTGLQSASGISQSACLRTRSVWLSSVSLLELFHWDWIRKTPLHEASQEYLEDIGVLGSSILHRVATA